MMIIFLLSACLKQVGSLRLSLLGGRGNRGWIRINVTLSKSSFLKWRFSQIFSWRKQKNGIRTVHQNSQFLVRNRDLATTGDRPGTVIN